MSASAARPQKSSTIAASSSAWSAVVTSTGHASRGRCRPPQGRRDGLAGGVDRQPRVGRRARGDAVGLLGEDADRGDAVAGEQRRDRAADHRLAGDRDQRLQVGAVARGERILARPRPGEQRSRSGRSCQPGYDLAARARLDRRLGQPDRVEDQREMVHKATSSRPTSGRREQQREEQDHHVGIAPRGDQPELAVDRPPDVDVHRRGGAGRCPRSALGDIAADDRPQQHGRIDRLERRGRRPSSPWSHAHHQNGGWTRSMPWSKTLPHSDEVPVQRASLPSTVSSTMKHEARRDARASSALPEQEEGEHAQERADRGHHVGRQAGRAPPSGSDRRPGCATDRGSARR